MHKEFLFFYTLMDFFNPVMDFVTWPLISKTALLLLYASDVH